MVDSMWCLRVLFGQGDASAVDGAGFHYEVYGAIEHAVLMPLMEYHWRQHSNGSGPAGGDREDGDDALFSEVLAAGTAKAGEQVRMVIFGEMIIIGINSTII